MKREVIIFPIYISGTVNSSLNLYERAIYLGKRVSAEIK